MVTVTPSPTGCADGSTDQDFGIIPSTGKKVHGCNGSVPYASAGSVCAAGSGWHLGDVWSDTGLGALLSSTIGNNNRWVAMNGDPGTLNAIDDVDSDGLGDRFCWGSPPYADCPLLIVFPDYRPIHITLATGEKSYYNGSPVSTDFIRATNGTIFFHGAICVEN
jgi:hypothetical protein